MSRAHLTAKLALSCVPMLSALPAAAASPPATACADANVEVDATLEPSWIEAVNAACASIISWPDRDLAARLVVDAAPPGVRVTVRLPDGRSAERTTSRPEELRLVFEALVTLPPSPSEAPREAEPPRETEAVAPPTPPTPPAPTTEHETVPLALDVSVLGTARFAGSPATLGVGAIVSANVDIDEGWIVGLRARVDPLVAELDSDGIVGGELGGGFELARRIEAQDIVAVDLGVGLDGLAAIPYEGGRRRDDVTGDVRPRVFGKAWVSGAGISFVGLLGCELSPVRLAEHGRGERAAFGVELGAGVGWSDL